MDRLYLLLPALVFLAAFSVAFVVYCGMCAVGRPPEVRNLKHNELLGPFMARYLVWLIGPVERALIGRVSANVVTAVSLLMCAATGIAVGTGNLGTAVWLYAFAGILDILDGRLARHNNQQTATGALFDSVSDRWGELFVFTGYAWYLRETPWLLAVMGAAGSSLMVSYTRARAEGLGLDLAGGIMQRAERIILVTAGTLLAAWYNMTPAHADVVVPVLGWTLALCCLTSTATALNRWIVATRLLARRESSADTLPIQPVAPVPLVRDDRSLALAPAKLRESTELVRSPAPATRI